MGDPISIANRNHEMQSCIDILGPDPQSLPSRQDRRITDPLDPSLRTRIAALCAEGWDFFERFDREVREKEFHSFIASDYEVVLDALIAHRAPGRTFLELGSASGVITIMADLLGYDASGIEIDTSLVATARKMAAKFDSKARFVAGSFFPTGYTFKQASGDIRTGTMGEGIPAYLELGHGLDDYDVVFGYPWGGEEPVMLDLMKRYGNPESVLMLHGVNDGVKAYRNGKLIAR
jgi:hypothetical protein